MAILIKVRLIDQDGDEADVIGEPILSRGYANLTRRVQTLSATKEQIRVPFDTIQFVYIKSNGKDVNLYKNLSPEWLTFDQVYLAFDVDISQLHLKSDDGAVVEMFIGGE